MARQKEIDQRLIELEATHKKGMEQQQQLETTRRKRVSFQDEPQVYVLPDEVYDPYGAPLPFFRSIGDEIFEALDPVVTALTGVPARA